MKNFGTRSSIIVGLCGAALLLTNVACSSSSTPGDGGAAGTSAAGGSGGTSAAGGGAGTSAAPVLSYTFDSSVQGWKLQTYVEPASSSYHDLGGLAAADAAMPPNYPVVSENTTEGMPNPGCLQVTATFTDYQQYVEVLVPVAMVNLTGKKIHALVQSTTAFYGGAFVYADSGLNYVYGGGGGAPIGTGTWTSLVLDPATVVAPAGSPSDFNVTDIVQMGVHIYSDMAPTDGGAFTTASYTFLIDTVIAQ